MYMASHPQSCYGYGGIHVQAAAASGLYYYFDVVVVVSGVWVSMVLVVVVLDPVAQVGVLSKWSDQLLLVLLEVEVVVHVRS